MGIELNDSRPLARFSQLLLDFGQVSMFGDAIGLGALVGFAIGERGIRLLARAADPAKGIGDYSRGSDNPLLD